MLLKKSVQKTKMFFLKTLQSLKSFLFLGYERLPKPKTLFLNPLSYETTVIQAEFDQHYADRLMIVRGGSAPWIKVPPDASDGESINECSWGTNKDEILVRGKKEELISSQPHATERSCMLAEKMKELEMMNVGDVDHTLDVEEALHYYSRLTYPVYLNMVNKFFMDMYTEFVLPTPSISTSTSSTRVGPSSP